MAAEDYDDALVCCVENTIDDRIIDSGASFHATYCKEELKGSSYAPVHSRPKEEVNLCWAVDKGKAYHRELRRPAVGKKVTKGSMVIAHGNKRKSLYMVEVPSNGINVAIDGRGNAALWHQRLGYMSEKGMKILASKGRILDLQKVVVGFCEPCVLGKQKKVFNTFKKWKGAVENETNLRVKCLKSNNGREYSSREFIEYCAENGIRMLKTIPETPQQNGVVERINRTLNERAKSMRLHAELLKMFWEDSVTTAAYLINRGPSVPLGFLISEEKWQGKEVSLAHLRVFGCDSYVKVKDVARDKLDAKSMKCTFIGYGSDEMGYRFWDSKSHKKDQVALEDSPENLANKSIVIEHGLSSEITQSLSGSSDASEGSENSGSFEDGGRSNEEDYKDRASSEEGGSETPQLQRSTRESRAPVRLVLSIVAVENLHLEQLDIKTAFLHGDLDEDIYMTQPEGFQSARKEENLVCPAKQILGMSIIKDKTKGTLRLSQEKYMGKVLEKFNMKDAEAKCQHLGDHFKLIGSVMYAMVCTRPYIAHAVGVVSRFMSNPGREHWEAVKWLLRYLKDSGKSTTGYVFIVGGTTVSWMSRIQKCVAMSTTKAEYMAIAEAGKELVWLKNFIEELDRAQTDEGTLSLKKILRAKNPADMLTKVVTTEKLKLCAASTGLRDN
ncbi:retrovirus-related pol polyprotein from transposon TNT 1-94 [Tanacetum coccineum]